MPIEIRRLSAAEFSLLAPELVNIYLEAMDYSSSLAASRVTAWRRDIRHPGHSALIAVAGDEIVGLAYGFLGTPDHWWDRHLRRALQRHGADITSDSDGYRAILRSYFELAELHVLPQWQGHGIGKQLLLQLSWNLPADYMLLSTPEIDGDDNRAFGLYRSLGFQDMLRGVYYPGDSLAYAILKASLPFTES